MSLGEKDEAEDFEILMDAFEQLGITPEEVDEYFKVKSKQKKK